MQVEKEQYEYYLVFVEKFKKRCPSGIDQEEYESFLNLEFCAIVNSFFQKREKNQTTANIENYVNAALKKAIIYKYYAKKTRKQKSKEVSYIDASHIISEVDKLEGKTEHSYFKKLKNESEIMNDPKLKEVFISEKVGWIDLKNDLFVGLNLRHICFILLNLQGVAYKRIAYDFKCSVKTVERVIKVSKEMILINAHKLGYKI